jgi:hypothetical protein
MTMWSRKARSMAGVMVRPSKAWGGGTDDSVARVDDGEVGEVRTMACEVRVVWMRREQRHDRAHNNEVRAGRHIRR